MFEWFKKLSFGCSFEERVQGLIDQKQALREDLSKSANGARAVIDKAHQDIERYRQIAESMNHI